MARIVYDGPPPPPRAGMPGYNGGGFSSFFDKLLIHGLELFGLYYGTYRAIVISNEDPDNKGNPDKHGRLTVRVPIIGDGKKAERIAYPIVPFAGESFGIKFLPKKDDQVYVEFENGKPDMPLWKGGWWADGDIPDDFKETTAHGIFTRTGHQILIDETDGSEQIQVKHSAGAEIVLDKDGNIKITNKDGQEVHVGKEADEAAAKGDTLKDLLEELIGDITSLTVPTGVGPSGTPINAPQFEATKAKLKNFLSTTVKVK